MHPLDNVIWTALTTRQSEFAESFAHARRFVREVTSLSAFHYPNDEGYESLAGLVGTGGTAGLFLTAPYTPRRGWSYVAGAPMPEMICDNSGAAATPSPASQVSIVELGRTDSPDMVELAALTKPGPFATRTHELGTYLGIRIDGKLVAMAGERLKIPGHTEISAVCTHPDYLGRGYARLLMTELVQRILSRGEIPFLHVRQDNVRAIELYQRLGFRERVLLHYAVIRNQQVLTES